MSYYDTTPCTCVVNVLGTEYGIWLDVPENADPLLENCSGYCDKTVKRIVIIAETKDSELSDWGAYRRSCMRHEIVHAFLTESGLDGNTHWDVQGEEHPEQMVEWIALQFPKLLRAFQEVGAL